MLILTYNFNKYINTGTKMKKIVIKHGFSEIKEIVNTALSDMDYDTTRDSQESLDVNIDFDQDLTWNVVAQEGSNEGYYIDVYVKSDETQVLITTTRTHEEDFDEICRGVECVKRALKDYSPHEILDPSYDVNQFLAP